MAELAAGVVLEQRFRLLSRLARGGMSEIWLATDESDGQLVLKILADEFAGHAGFVELLSAECAKAKRLRHPNIVRVYDVHDSDGLHFISMEYVDGPNLTSLRNAEWQRIATTLLPVAEALQYAHDAGVVHRDIKPANILLDAAGSPRLTDFGISSVLAADPAAQIRTGGSLPAMSPQQVTAEAPAITDDVYGFGALLYDLLSGAPLFHPEVTRERVLGEVPAPLTQVPAELDALVRGMLAKEPVRRPAGMGAVRNALQALLADQPAAPVGGQDSDNTITAIARRRRSTEQQPAFEPAPLQTAATASGSRPLLYAGLAILGMTALAVVFLLPDMVADRVIETPPVVAAPAAAPEPQPEEPAANPAAQGSREIADQVLGDLLQLTDELQEAAVELWGGADWATAQTAEADGDESYKGRLYADAADAYRRALALLTGLQQRQPQVLATALADGEQAFLNANQQLALERFDLALAIDPGNPTATAGRERTLQLGRVLERVAAAEQAELDEDWPAAAAAYAQALEVDPDWPAAREGRVRVQAIISGGRYQAAMSAGYGALAAGEYARARQSFRDALGARPGDADASAALAQVDIEQRAADIVRLTASAEELAADENWRAAAARYQEVLALDPTVVAATRGLEQSQQRGQLDERLNSTIGAPDKLADEAVWQSAKQLLDFASGQSPQGALLTRQIAELDRLLKRAAIPVSVRFDSDGLTDVVIYKVGRLGAFASRTVDLRPGTYTAVGVRNGYRDVRRTFRVAPEQPMQPVVMVCEDPI